MTTTPHLSAQRRKDLRGFLEQEAAKSLKEAPVAARRRRAAGVVAGVAGVTAVLGVAPLLVDDETSVLAPPVAAAGVSFTADGDQIVARITDPEASAQEMTAAFAAEGLDITVVLVPADPELVGRVVMTSTSDWRDGQISDINPEPGCRTAAGAPCPSTVEVPVDFTATGEVAIGRAPRPGESVVAESTGW